jgi:Na+/pantothenate symporter
MPALLELRRVLSAYSKRLLENVLDYKIELGVFGGQILAYIGICGFAAAYVPQSLSACFVIGGIALVVNAILRARTERSVAIFKARQAEGREAQVRLEEITRPKSRPKRTRKPPQA